MFESSLSIKRKFIMEALFRAELNEFFKRELSAEDGFSGIEIRNNPSNYQIFIKATKTQQVVGEKGRRIRELSSVISKRFNLTPDKIVLVASKVEDRGLCAMTQAESLRYKLIEGVAVRRACYGVIRYVMDSGARGVEIVVSGKLRGQRAKSMKFLDGLMIHSGHPVKEFVRTAVRHVQLRQGMLGIKVKIMLPDGHTCKGKISKPLPDHISILKPKEEPELISPYSVNKEEPCK
ncbi:hypothetical protein GJ496_001496 [Pomphorhynchus laevis]|nr:hypothetical protein GJ496_001496 [Pomphorhynchus laevis]